LRGACNHLDLQLAKLLSAVLASESREFKSPRSDQLNQALCEFRQANEILRKASAYLPRRSSPAARQAGDGTGACQARRHASHRALFPIRTL